MPQLRIAQIDVFARELPIVDGGFRIADHTLTSLDSTIVKITCEDGTVGFGETCPLGPTHAPAHAGGARAAIATIAPALVGLTLSHPARIHDALDAQLNGHAYAKSAIDIAAFDLFGKVLGLSVADFIGGARVRHVPSYHAIGASNADAAARDARDKVAVGFTRFQLKVGGQAVEEDAASVRAVYEALGSGMRLSVDGNRSMTTRDALMLDRLCSDIPFVFEQPCDTLAEMNILRSATSRPVHLDESGVDLETVLRAAVQGMCDGFAMKLSRMGGLAPMAVFRDVCAVRNMPHTCDDSWGGDIVAAACVHMAATVDPKRLDGVWIAQPYIDGHDCSEGGISIENGSIRVPDGPGLGITLDEARFGTPVATFGN